MAFDDSPARPCADGCRARGIGRGDHRQRRDDLDTSSRACSHDKRRRDQIALAERMQRQRRAGAGDRRDAGRQPCDLVLHVGREDEGSTGAAHHEYLHDFGVVEFEISASEHIL